MHRFSELLAATLAPKNVFVFSISPGLVQTEMTSRVPGRPAVDAARVRAGARLALASGEFDALAGRYLHAEHDPPDALRARVDEILEQDLNVIRLRRRHGTMAAMRLALAQINTVVGDLDGNRELILARLEEAKAPAPTSSSSPSSRSRGTRPRTCCCGPASCARPSESLEEIAPRRAGSSPLVGVAALRPRPLQRVRGLRGRRGEGVVQKRFLPNYGVFDEIRYFAPGDELVLFEHGETLVGVDGLRGHVAARAAGDRPRARRRAADRQHLRLAVPRAAATASARRCSARARATTAAYVAFCNTVGGQDELIFDGHSLVIDDEGTVLARAPGFEEALLVVDVEPAAVVARRLTRRAPPRARARSAAISARCTTIHVGAPHEQARAPSKPP